MNFLKIYRNLMVAYAGALLLTGILMDLPLINSFFATIPFNTYDILKNLHKNIFVYGIVLNALPGILFFLIEKYQHDHLKNLLLKSWIIYQLGVILGLLGLGFGNHQIVNLMEMQYFADLIIFISFSLFLVFSVHLYRSLIQNFQSEVMKFILLNFLFLPFLVFVIYYFFLNMARPAGIVSSIMILSPHTLNLLEYGFTLFCYNYFILNLAFGLLYVVKMTSKEDISFLKGVQIQWYLHTILFILNLYFQLVDFQSRDLKFISTLSSQLVYIPCFIAVLNLRYQGAIEDTTANKVYIYIIMFIQIFALGNIVTGFFRFTNILTFSEWGVGQKHVLGAGIILPTVYLLLHFLKGKNHRLEKYNQFYIFLWMIASLFFVATNWVFGAIQAGMTNKFDFFGYLDYPGWVEIIEVLVPYRTFRFITGLFFAGLLLVLYFRRQKLPDPGQSR